MGQQVTVLLSARDMGGWQHLRAILPFLSSQADLVLHLAVEGVARQDLERASGGCLPDIVPYAPGVTVHPAEMGPDQLVADIRPDLILVCGSGADQGIDEKLANAFAGPCLVFQDFWGDINPALICRPNIQFLVLDEIARNLTLDRLREKAVHAPNVTITGSLYHEDMRSWDLETLKQRFQAQFSDQPAAGEKVLLIAGQPFDEPVLCDVLGLDSAQGRYSQMIVETLAHIASVAPDIRLVYRPHPRETRLPEFPGLNIDRQPDPGPALASADMVLAVTSGMVYDAVMLDNYRAGSGVQAGWFCLDTELQNALARYSGTNMHPLAEAGILPWLTDRDMITAFLQDRASAKIRNAHFVPNKLLAGRRVLQIIRDSCS